MPINFPNSPSPNQQYTYDSKTWEWNGIYWEVYSALTSYVTSTTFNSYTGVTQPLIYSSITGGTYSGGTLYLVNNSGGTITITGFSTSSSGGTISGDYLPLSGGTVTGGTIFQSGLTANTISATTYQNLPTDIRVTGATYSNNTFTYTNNTGGTFNVLFNTVTGLTVNGVLTVTGTTSSGTISATTYQNLPISGLTAGQNISITGSNGNFTVSVTGVTSGSNFTGGTVSGATNFTGGLTANTISATTYQNLPTDIRVTGVTYSNNTFTYTNNTGGTFNVLFNTVTGLTVNGNLTVTGTTTSGTISATTYQNLPISGLTAGQDISITGSNGNFTISFTGNTSGSFTGGTVTGPTIFTNGLTSNTISATTYLNLPIDVFVTGGTYSAGTATFTNNTGGTFDVTGIVTPFTGGTVSGPTNFTNGLSANTISATTYLNLPVTPVYIKIGSMSGRFTSTSLNSPSISQMYVGNTNFGWSYGDYDYNSNPDGFGNIRDIRHRFSNVGIPLPTDILSGDKIKICGMCYFPERGVQPTNETFYVTVSYFTCRDYLTGRDFNVSTLIPVASYVFDETRSICFSEEIITNTTLPGCTTYLVVGMTVGNDDETENTYKFSYTLDSTQSTSSGANLFIRNCCDPAYSEVIQNNGVAVGKSFVDSDGNCWSVVSETTSDITEDRVLTTEYDDCVLCIDSNVCPENFVVQSCCGGGDQTFTAALEGISVGDTFVDDFGFCWSVIATTPTPITNVVTIGTVYSSTTCESLECTDENTCPNLLLIVSCCKDMGAGYTTSDILGISVAINDVFVDTFGICWQVRSENNVGFPSLNFLSGSTNYGSNACEDCIISNACEINLFYTVQNCCDETIEVVELPAQYSIGLTLGLTHDTGVGCYKVLSWSDVGTSTLTGTKVVSTYSGDKNCNNCIANFLNNTCIGQIQCCTSYQAQVSDLTITGYLCDGTWVFEQSVPLGTSVCMALAFNPSESFTTSCCDFLVYNPSPTTLLEFEATDCEGNTGVISVRPLETSSVCVNCVSKATGPWEWAACP